MLLSNLRVTALIGFIQSLQTMSLDRKTPLPKRLKARREILGAQEALRVSLENLRTDTRGTHWRAQPGLSVRVRSSGLLGAILSRQEPLEGDQVLCIHAKFPDKPRAYYPAELEVVIPKHIFDSPNK